MWTKFKRWLLGVFVADDELLNATADGNAHETVSAHCGHQYAVGKPCIACRVICGFIQSVLGHFTLIDKVSLVPPTISFYQPWAHLKTHCANAWKDEQAMVEAAKGLPGEKN